MPHTQQDDPAAPYSQVPLPAEVYAFVHNPAYLTDGEDCEIEHQDIYRGPPPPTPRPPRSPSPVPSSSPSSSSSSSSSTVSVFGGRLGAISAGVEHAISRWARAWMSTSSLSSSSSSASVTTQSKSQTTRLRRRRPRSIATLHNARSEREVAARIRAREDLRNIPRGFVLYTPRLPIVGARSQAAAERRAARAARQDPILRTTSLDEMTARLSAVLRERTKARRVRTITERTEPSLSRPFPPAVTGPPVSRPRSLPIQDYMLSDERAVARPPQNTVVGSSTSAQAKGKDKGKAKESSFVPVPTGPPAVPASSPPLVKLVPTRVPQAWWLDVTSPTWEDMCAIGKLLHLHPLTLEDILTQDPREKLELFPKLGYYFISFRAVESQKTRDRMRGLLGEDDVSEHDEGIVGEVNVYLVVFREGICSFHFSDIVEHVDRVRHRMMLLGDNANTSSDWIAHGLMDSIVDSFFPFLHIIEKEVVDIERLVFSAGSTGDASSWPKEHDPTTTAVYEQRSSATDVDHVIHEKKDVIDMDEKNSLNLGKASIKSIAPRPHISAPTSFPLLVCRARRAIYKTLASIPRFKTINEPSGEHHPTTTIHRMARIRRLVTSLTRFLAVKSEVVAQVKKRLLTKGEWSLGMGTEDDLDVFVYMGDVQDHILTLQQSLAHYERMLSQSHPTYLSQLRISVNKAKSGSDKAIVSLTVVSLGVLCVQTSIGLGSMNCEVPHNDLEGDRYNVFAVVISIAIVIICIYGCVVRYWWVQAQRHRLHM